MTKKNIMEYEGYIAELTLDTEDNIIIGRVVNTADILSFHGESVEEAKQAFMDVMDTYLEVCAEEGISPSRPYSGKFNVRITPELHRDLSSHAAVSGMTLNEYVMSVLSTSLRYEARL